MKDYKGKVKLVIKQYPYKYREYAYISSEAALSAGEQGKYWEMHEILLKRSPKLDRKSLESYASEIGLDMTKFKDALDKRKFLPVIEKDIKLAQSLDLYNTPTIFINGIKIVGNRPYDYYKKTIDDELRHEKKK